MKKTKRKKKQELDVTGQINSNCWCDRYTYMTEKIQWDRRCLQMFCFKKGNKRRFLQAAHSPWPYAEQSGKV